MIETNSRVAIAAAALAVLGLGAGLGYWWAGQRAGDTLPAAGMKAERRILYYRNPMGLPDTSPSPKKDPMGMAYIPVYEGEETGGSAASGGIVLSPEKIQTLGVLTEPVQRGPWLQKVRAVGRLTATEPGLSTVTTKVEGWIESLYVNSTGQQVHRGQALMALYSPELVSAQQELLIALSASSRLNAGRAEAVAGAEAIVAAARDRLRNWDIGPQAIARLEKTGEIRRTLVLTAPADGVVLERMATLGMRVMPGERLFEIADLSEVWLLADVFEQDLSAITVGGEAAIEVASEPGRRRAGRVEFIYPTLNEMTRTTQVRVVIDNRDRALRPGMFATAEISSTGEASVLSVSSLALLDTGERQLVFVDAGAGRFQPREVRGGRRADGRIEILAGLAEGDKVVTRANFLIDAESNLRSAIGGLSPHAGHGETRKPVAEPDHNGNGSPMQMPDAAGAPGAGTASHEPVVEDHQGHEGH